MEGRLTTSTSVLNHLVVWTLLYCEENAELQFTVALLLLVLHCKQFKPPPIHSLWHRLNAVGLQTNRDATPGVNQP